MVLTREVLGSACYAIMQLWPISAVFLHIIALAGRIRSRVLGATCLLGKHPRNAKKTFEGHRDSVIIFISEISFSDHENTKGASASVSSGSIIRQRTLGGVLKAFVPLMTCQPVIARTGGWRK